MILLPTGLYIKTSEEQLVVNNILKNFHFITGLIANNGISNTYVFKIILFTCFKNPLSLNIIPQHSADQKCIIQVTCICLYLVMRYHYLLRPEKITNTFCREERSGIVG